MNCKPARFEELRGRMFRLYREGRYKEALEVVEEVARVAPEREGLTAFWTACLLCRLGDLERALHTLEEAHAHGRWWGKEILMGDPDLEPLRDLPAFQNLVAQCERQKRMVREQAKPELLSFVPPGFQPGEPHPLSLAFHGRFGSAEKCLESLSSVVDAGFVLCALQGTQAVGENMYVWDDIELAKREARWAYDRMEQDFELDRKRLFLGGFSQGASLAMELAVTGVLPVGGFAAVFPATWRTETWASQIVQAAQRGLRGWILIGQEDPRFGAIQGLHQGLRKAGLNCLFEAVPQLGHELPPDFPERLRRALAFLAGDV